MPADQGTLTKFQPTLLLLILGLFYFASPIIIPITIAILLSILLTPAVEALLPLCRKRWLAVVCLLLAVGAGVVLAGTLLYRSLFDLAAALPQSFDKVKNLFAGLSDALAGLKLLELGSPAAEPSARVTQVEIVERFPVWLRFLLRGVSSASDLALMLFFIPLITTYLLIDKPKLVESSSAILGEHFNLPKIYNELPRVLRAFMFGNLLVGALLGVCHCVILYTLGLSSWPALGIISGFLSMIPLVGTPISLVFTIFGCVGELSSLSPVAFVVVGFSIADIVASNLLLPLIVGSRINLNSACLAIGLLFWGWYWGAIGFVLAIPMTATIKIFLEANRKTLRFANLMASKPRYVIGDARKAKIP